MVFKVSSGHSEAQTIQPKMVKGKHAEEFTGRLAGTHSLFQIMLSMGQNVFLTSSMNSYSWYLDKINALLTYQSLLVISGIHLSTHFLFFF